VVSNAQVQPGKFHFFGMWFRCFWVAARAFFSGRLLQLGIKKTGGKILAPINSPTRYPEFSAALRLLTGRSTECTLDVGSPKMFVHLLRDQLDPKELWSIDQFAPEIGEVRALLGNRKNFFSEACDVKDFTQRKQFQGYFDLVTSISVIEHVEPEVGGDCIAIEGLAKCIKPGGALLLSVPVASHARPVYLSQSEYGRELVGGRVFFERLYDTPTLLKLVDSSGPWFELEHCIGISWPKSEWLRRMIVTPAYAIPRILIGVIFPVFAARFKWTWASKIPKIDDTGDVVLLLRRK
jgi:hypothetical protein